MQLIDLIWIQWIHIYLYEYNSQARHLIVSLWKKVFFVYIVHRTERIETLFDILLNFYFFFTVGFFPPFFLSHCRQARTKNTAVNTKRLSLLSEQQGGGNYWVCTIRLVCNYVQKAKSETMQRAHCHFF